METLAFPKYFAGYSESTVIMSFVMIIPEVHILVVKWLQHRPWLPLFSFAVLLIVLSFHCFPTDLPMSEAGWIGASWVLRLRGAPWRFSRGKNGKEEICSKAIDQDQASIGHPVHLLVHIFT